MSYIRLHTSIITLFLAMMVFPSFGHESFPDFKKIMKGASPAVVSVLTFENLSTNKALVPDDLAEDLENTPLMEVLREMWGNDLEKKLYGETEPGLGSGTLISADGYIITNYHVVANSDTIYVQLKDRRDYPAQLIGFDEGTDLALLKIQGSDLPYVNMAVEPVEVGEWVVAIGAPFGFEDTLTAGVVSAKRRSLGAEKYVPFIQTDVAINPGNSGGPLLNLKGEMVGVNSQIVSQSGGYSGLSFSVPVSVVLSVINQIKQQGYVERGWLGLAFQDLNRNLAKSFGLTIAKGALISKVVPGSPAEQAGLRIGDILIAMNDKEIRKASDVPPIVGVLPIGTNVKIHFIRSKKEIQSDLTLGRATDRTAKDKKSFYAFFAQPEDTGRGIQVRQVDPAKETFLDDVRHGVVVSSLDSFGWRTSGLRAGDVIMQVNGETVDDPKDFYQFIDKMTKSDMYSFLVLRRGEIQRFIAVNGQ